MAQGSNMSDPAVEFTPVTSSHADIQIR